MPDIKIPCYIPPNNAYCPPQPGCVDNGLWEYEFLCRVKQQLETTVNTVNELIKDWAMYSTELKCEWNRYQTELLAKYNELQSYVNNYFTNLNVQTEINNKIHDMVEDGSLLALMTPTINDKTKQQLREMLENGELAPLIIGDKSITTDMLIDQCITLEKIDTRLLNIRNYKDEINFNINTTNNTVEIQAGSLYVGSTYFTFNAQTLTFNQANNFLYYNFEENKFFFSQTTPNQKTCSWIMSIFLGVNTLEYFVSPSILYTVNNEYDTLKYSQVDFTSIQKNLLNVSSGYDVLFNFITATNRLECLGKQLIIGGKKFDTTYQTVTLSQGDSYIYYNIVTGLFSSSAYKYDKNYVMCGASSIGADNEYYIASNIRYTVDSKFPPLKNIITDDNLLDNSISGDKLTDNSITTDKYAVGSVDRNVIADDAVIEANIQNGAVTSAKLMDGAVTSAKLRDGAVTSAKLSILSVSEAKIGNNAVTENKIKDFSITSNKIKNNAITEDKLDNESVSTDKLQQLSVTSEKIPPDTITETQLTEKAVTTKKIKDGSVTRGKIANYAINREKIIDGLKTLIPDPQILGDVITFNFNFEDNIILIYPFELFIGNIKYEIEQTSVTMGNPNKICYLSCRINNNAVEFINDLDPTYSENSLLLATYYRSTTAHPSYAHTIPGINFAINSEIQSGGVNVNGKTIVDNTITIDKVDNEKFNILYQTPYQLTFEPILNYERATKQIQIRANINFYIGGIQQTTTTQTIKLSEGYNLIGYNLTSKRFELMTEQTNLNNVVAIRGIKITGSIIEMVVIAGGIIYSAS